MTTCPKLEDAVTGQAVISVGKLGPLQSLPPLNAGKGSGGGLIVSQEGEKPRNNVADKMRQLMERWEQSIRAFLI